MSSYRTHTVFNLAVALPICCAAMVYALQPSYYDLGTFGIAFIYGTLFMSPDVDLAHQNKLFSLKGLLTLPFRSYALVFRHRGMSHHWILGTFTRVFWLFIFATLGIYLAYSIAPNSQTVLGFYQKYEAEVLFSMAGLISADWGHLLLDGHGLRRL